MQSFDGLPTGYGTKPICFTLHAVFVPNRQGVTILDGYAPTPDAAPSRALRHYTDIQRKCLVS